MEIIIWLLVTIPCSLLSTGIGIYALRREKPMWFWSGSSVREARFQISLLRIEKTGSNSNLLCV